ncbi:hypothetical protein DPMN_144734 [Dreissena polymorpha]|uniref:Uncharacterized protein n=2 Tax=Dreissena polymorpha TaxID=45954 RepID=A0A9D4F4L3_DREPO|nr:hypothetical protein DPMN_144734 [Dreissena polymorpha]
MDVAQMSTSIEQLLKRLEDMLKIGEQHINSLQTSYETALKEIHNERQRIDDNLDRLQENTIRNLEQLHSRLKTSLENESKRCIECVSKLRSYDTKDTHSTSLERSFVAYQKCLDHSASVDSFHQNVLSNIDIVFERNKDLEQILASCTELGSIASYAAVSHYRIDPNEVVSVIDKSQYKVRTPTDKENCYITGICGSSNGEFVIADFNNKCVKLLDQGYTLLAQLQLPTFPLSLCNISTNEMAVTVGDVGSANEIHFLRVDKRSIVNFKTLQLNHSCYGISIHQSDMFVTSGVAVYQYWWMVGCSRSCIEIHLNI